MPNPEIAVLLSTYQRPEHLRRSLLSLALQQGAADRMEVVVTDDGAPEISWPVVQAFARSVGFPVQFTTHRRHDFHLARCRNEGIAVSTAPYLLISDGDCVFPSDHVLRHLEFRQIGQVAVGDCVRLDRSATEILDGRTIRDGTFGELASEESLRRLAQKCRHAFWYRLLGLKTLPRLTGSNIGVWRSDLEAVNGFDENFVGWGLEDRDLQLRLSRLGVRFRSILDQTAAYHLWHEPAPTFARKSLGTKNLEYFRRRNVETRCSAGLQERIAANGERLRDGAMIFEETFERTPEGEIPQPRIIPIASAERRRLISTSNSRTYLSRAG